MHDELDEVAETKRQRFNLLSNIWHHDITNRLKMRRASDAKAMGLGDDYPVGTYPSHPASVVVVGGGGPGKWLGLAVAAATGMGLIGGLQYLAPLLSKPAAVAPAAQEWDLEIISVDGKPVVKGVQRGREDETD